MFDHDFHLMNGETIINTRYLGAPNQEAGHGVLFLDFESGKTAEIHTTARCGHCEPVDMEDELSSDLFVRYAQTDRDHPESVDALILDRVYVRKDDDSEFKYLGVTKRPADTPSGLKDVVLFRELETNKIREWSPRSIKGIYLKKE